MPMPVSETASVRWSPVRHAATLMTPSSVNLAALDSRLRRICLSFSRSVCTRRQIGIDLGDDAHPVGLEHGLDGGAADLHQLAEVEADTGDTSMRPASILERSSSPLIRLQQVLGADEHLLQVGMLHGRDLALGLAHHQAREADDGVHGRPQLVADVGQELRLQAIGLLELLVERHQLLGALGHLVLQAGVGLLQSRAHAVELVGERLQLVAGLHLEAEARFPRPIRCTP